ncbi:hypothetical protein V1264_005807 [Littorina saxatilis]|uniref:Uncharacterized protein n=1 Tax=Littorina saxatilis TaxID=31220 RepID=A0AAN9AZQ9_9CAEN
MATAEKYDQHFQLATATDRCDDAKNSLKGHFICVNIQGDIFQASASTADKKKRPTVVETFLKVVNALFNEGCCVLCLHANKPDLDFVGDFTEQVDDKVNYMFVDGVLFDEKIKQAIDICTRPLRLIYRVVSTKSELPVFLNYNTKVSLDKGLTDLAPKQFQTFFHKVKTRRPPEQTTTKRASKTNTFKFIENKEVTGKCPFKETRNQQAKSVPKQYTGNIKRLTKFMWEHLKLPQYISAFSKNVDGGSVFFGFVEKKLNIEKWQREEPSYTPISLEDPDWKLWKDRNNTAYLVASLSKPPSIPRSWTLVHNETAVQGIFTVANDGQWNVYKDSCVSAFHVAKESDVPKAEQKTGKIICEGLFDVQRFEENLKTTLRERIRDELLWLGTAQPEDPVTFRFHPVVTETGQPTNKWVIELIVEYFHGVIFTQKEGPEVYRLNSKGVQKAVDIEDLVERLETEEWLSAQLDEEDEELFTAQTPSFRGLNHN